MIFSESVPVYTLFFYKQQFYKQCQAEIDKKNKQKLRNTMRLNFLYLKIIRFLHPRYQTKIIEEILKNVQKTSESALMMLYNYVMTLKMWLKMKNRSQRYDKN